MKLKFTNKMKGANKFNNKAYIVDSNRQCLSADGFSLLPSALRPCLFLLLGIATFAITSIFNICSGGSAFAADSSLSLIIDNSTLSLDLSPNSSSGNFASSGNMNISVTTSHSSGYTLSISPKNTGDNANKLLNGSNAINSINSAITEATFVADSSYKNMWGYKPSKYLDAINNIVVDNTNTESSVYLPVIADRVLDKTTTANSSANAYTISIGTKVDQTIPKGAYGNIFVFTITANPTPYTITYNANAGNDSITNMPTPNPQAGSVDGNSVVLSNAAPSRDGYTFSGWCTDNTSETICNGTNYAAGTSYPIDQTNANNNTINLYAIWKPPLTTFDEAYSTAGKTKLNNYYKMQDMSSDLCAAVLIGQETQLIDIRDDKVYYVAKLADDNCWMTQNLDHDVVTTANFYTYANTDIGHGDTTNTSATWTSSEGTIICDDPNGYYCYYTMDGSTVDVSNYCWNGAVNSSTPVTCAQNSSHYHLGNYYTYLAATAGHSSRGDSDDIIDQSICPAGWTLPLGGNNTSTKSFYYLFSYYNYSGSTSSGSMINPYAWGEPLFYSLGGSYSMSFPSIGSEGKYWSNTINSVKSLTTLTLNSNGNIQENLTTVDDDTSSIRCVAR